MHSAFELGKEEACEDTYLESVLKQVRVKVKSWVGDHTVDNL